MTPVISPHDRSAISPLPLPPAGFASLPGIAKFNLAVLGGFIVTLCFLLWPAWRHNPDLSHGLFMPLIFLVLLHESRTTGTRRWLPDDWRTISAVTVASGAALVALAAAGLYAAALGWSHTLVVFMLTLSLVLLLTTGWLGFATVTRRWVPLNWNALVAIGLWLLTAPLPLGTYTRLTLTLQLWVSENVLRALHILGVAAQRQGNLIELASGVVGVEEACSGVRSLISCVFAGLFFSASFVRRPLTRAVIVVLAAPLALGMNFIRSLTLTLLANAGIDIAGTWHDLTGFAVLGVTAIILGGLALLLGRDAPNSSPTKQTSALPPPGAETEIPAGAPRRDRSQFALAGGLVLAVVFAALFVINTHPTPRTDKPVPDLLTVLPAAVPGWQVATAQDLQQFASQLQTEHLAQRSYRRNTSNGPLEITLYLAYWRAGQTPVSQVASHTPDACWPGAGWEAIPTPVKREQLPTAGRMLPEAESRFFKSGIFPQHVWFWHLYDGRPILYENPYSPKALLKIAWRYGFRHDGDQLFVRVSSNFPWSEFGQDPLIAEFFRNTAPLGL